MTEQQAKDIARRRREDFEFLVLCQAKGNPAMYELLRDRTIDEDEKLLKEADLHLVLAGDDTSREG